MNLRGPVVALTGAGISTASGIPDFRSPGGVWERFDAMEFTIQRFHQDPARFWDRRARLIAAMDYLDAAPNAAHIALAQAAQAGIVSAIVTQNVDGLHSKAGTPAACLVELHGNGAWVACLGCPRKEPTEAVLARRVEGQAPRCLQCRGLLKPDVVLFGEPVTRLQRAAALVQGAGTLLVAGTSLQVHPAAGLVDLALESGADVVLINQEATPYDARATHVLREPVGEAIPRILAGSWDKLPLQ